GDTCSARLIPVIPVGDGERIVIDKEDEAEAEITAYPIPFRDEVILKYNLQNEFTSYRVFDSSGRIITTGLIEGKVGEKVIITQGWASGWYILELQDKNLKERFIVLVKE
ncbi:MAG: T9SS C-terminal target domain-containing protein, partial [Saprospirales bacterium]